MQEDADTVRVPKELKDLLPAFMENRRNDLHALRVALMNDDLEGLRFLGDRIKGVAGSYGFVRVAAIARLIEDKAKLGDRTALHWLVEQYASYISNVQVAVESPGKGLT